MQTNAPNPQKTEVPHEGPDIGCMNCNRQWHSAAEYQTDALDWAAEQSAEVEDLVLVTLEWHKEAGLLTDDGFATILRCPVCVVDDAKDGRVTRKIIERYRRLREARA